MPVGRFVEIAVDTPENIQSFALVKEIDTSQLTLATGSSFTGHAVSSVNNCRVIKGNLQSDVIENNASVLDTMGFIRHQKEQYSIITKGSTYKPLMTSSEFGGALNRHFEPVEMSEKPIDWDENYNWKYYIKLQSGTFTDNPVYVNADATWSSTTQYYINTQDFHYYYIIDGDKKVRVGVGDVGLMESEHRMGICVAKNPSNDQSMSNNEGYWTFFNGDTKKRISDSTTDNTYFMFQMDQTQVAGFSNLFTGSNPFRYLSGNRYNSGWKSGVSAEAKGQWKVRVHNDVRIENVTITQFGFLNHEGHRYFGIWVLCPKSDYYVGHHLYTNAADNDYSDDTSLPDLRAINLNSPISQNEVVKWGNIFYYGVELDALEVTLEEKEGTMPPDINPDPTPSAGWTPLRPSLPTQRNLGSLASSDQAGFHVWCLAQPQFQGLVGDLWSWGTFESAYESQLQQHGSIYNPITNSEGNGSIGAVIQDFVARGRVDPLAAVQTCMALPGFIAPKVIGEADFGRVKVAGIKTAQQGYCCRHETYIAEFPIDCSNTAVTSSYLDIAPNTSAEIYLPYIGTVGLDPASFIGGSITVTYSCCVVDGTISATVVCTSSMAGQNVTQYGPYLGSASYRIPVAQKDANAFQRELGYVKAVGTAVTGAVGAAFGASKAIASTLAHTMFDTAGSLEQSVLTPQVMHGGELGSGSAIVCPTGDIQVQLSTPLPKHLDEADLKQYGMTSGKVGAIESNSGFVTYSYAKLDGIEATEAEIEEIKAILYGGVYQ